MDFYKPRVTFDGGQSHRTVESLFDCEIAEILDLFDQYAPLEEVTSRRDLALYCRRYEDKYGCAFCPSSLATLPDCCSE